MQLMISIADGRYKIFRLNTVRCSCYVIQYGNVNILIDTSTKMERKRLVRELSNHSINNINAIFITHNHTDHIGNAQWISEKYNCKIFISPLSLHDASLGSCRMPNPTNFTGKIICFAATKGTRIFDFSKYEACKNIFALSDEVVEYYLGSKVILKKTEGHTEDSMSFIINNKVAIVGDAMVNKFGKIYPPFANDERRLIVTWKRLIDTKAVLFLPAHGKPITKKDLIKQYNSRNVPFRSMY